MTEPSKLPNVTLSDKYEQPEGEVFLSGNQALVRLVLQQRARDAATGLNTAGFVSGYRGSPLGRLDMELWQSGDLLHKAQVKFQPGVNEDLAATAVWGSQQVGSFAGARYDGVFGIWYGKGPGVDRSGDAIKHANAAGVAPLGGVLALAGDDHGAKSSTQAHQSDYAFIAAGIPVLYPANVQEILDYGLHGLAMSRHAGCWVALKLVTDVVEGSSSVRVGLDSPAIVVPSQPAGDVHIKRIAMPKAQEEALYRLRLPAAMAYARANALNRIVAAAPDARIGVVTAGKSYADTRAALDRLGGRDGFHPDSVRLLKIGMVWPLDPEIVRQFARGLDTILVVEEKRPLLEDQIKAILFDDAAGPRPRVIGKFVGVSAWDAGRGTEVFAMTGELSPDLIATRIADGLRLSPASAPSRALALANATTPERAPTFCSGCPHSTSTRLPDGSLALAGIGCHSIALLQNPMRTGPLAHMGAEGVMWVGMAPFTDMPHVFANMGDGTYFHSGFLAIRQAIAAKSTITYKVLVNGFVSMTGGQPIEGELTPAQLATELLTEGVAKVVVVADDPQKYQGVALPVGVRVEHRERLELVQKELREVAGVSVLIYDQMCATERRRQRKRGKMPDPGTRTFINSAVCEGCGDCGEASNCLSVEPLETDYGRKRRINQASCNKDLSCVQGFCPSFVTVVGGSLRKPVKTAPRAATTETLPEPVLPTLADPIGVIVAGVGGTGVITLGAVIGMAAHLDGIAVSTLDLTGLAQKYGAVTSHIRLARTPDRLSTHRLADGDADVAIGADLIVAAGAETVAKLDAARTRTVVDAAINPTRDFSVDPDWSVDDRALIGRLEAATRETLALEATEIARRLVGDPLGANMLLLGFAWQKGWLPLSRAALEQAIRLNAVAVDLNLTSFGWGRALAHDPAMVRAAAFPPVQQPTAAANDTLDELVARRAADLTDYQNAALAESYRAFVAKVADREQRLGQGNALARAVARNYYKLLAVKDEYEVARLYTSLAFRRELEQTFDGEFTLRFHLGAGPFARHVDGIATPKKTEVGPWMMKAFHVLAALRRLRGSLLDPFRNNPERRLADRERDRYEADLDRLIAELDADRLGVAVEIASLPDKLRGYGHVRERAADDVQQRREALWRRWEHRRSEPAREKEAAL
ncbi:Indolepyruvate ferredoxin oxidoreductase [Rhodopseudomonas palustris TIE-1]|uniref:indolepyruvate ferredoxin oxidoreductase family protein n=1 Tax=Rhodopseudomonas palustris TaxID=1076 RepID=UPI00017795AF|nr:indolepyruvate ferredoxin oxidoreductase family protein [Rhodopseudomonas palustris]ACF00088.1 Indolepyruvate ferredoxin oxidoreductase [Rhodopseudomonas palustris TIE-1]